MGVKLEAVELEAARKVARKMAGKWVKIEADDLEQHLMLWLCAHERHLVRWREDPNGAAKLYVTLRREGSKFCAKETSEVLHVEDLTGGDYAYDKETIARVLPFMWEMDEWQKSAAMSGDGYALSVMTDISTAYWGLEEDERNLLAWRFRDGDTYKKLGGLLSMSEDGARKRVDRALQRLRQSIGSEKLSWTKPIVSTRPENWLEL